MQKSYIKLSNLAFLIILSLFLSSIIAANAPDQTTPTIPSLSMPLNCNYGVDCFIQNYMDLDSTDIAKDYKCNTRTYNGHTGTDFRVVDYKALDNNGQGVNILAADDGTVVDKTDKYTDFYFIKNNKTIQSEINDDTRKDVDPSIKSRAECGNGYVVKHGDGPYYTQYCHMKTDTLTKAIGDKVTKGEIIGKMGMSGQTEFPHIHLGLKNKITIIDTQDFRNKKNIGQTGKSTDPFINKTSQDNGVTCPADLNSSFWSPEVKAKLQYTESDIINIHVAGLTNITEKNLKDCINHKTNTVDKCITINSIDARNGKYRDEQAIASSTKYLVTWADFIGIKMGDILTIAIKDINGRVKFRGNTSICSDPQNMNCKDSPQYFLPYATPAYVNNKLTTGPLPVGEYRILVTVTRKINNTDTIVANRSASLKII